MWMLRGAGVTGLSGMRHDRRSLHALFIRPLLDRSREDILGYLSSEDLSFRQDSSNRSRTYRRNRIRHDVMPLLKELNPAIVRVLGRQADLLTEDNLVLEQETTLQLSRVVTRRQQNQVTLRQDVLLTLPKGIQRRIIRQVLQTQHAAGKAPSLRQVSALLAGIAQGRTGTSFRVGCCLVTKHSDFAVFESASLGQDPRSPQARACPQESSQRITLPLVIPSTIVWPPSGQRIILRVESRQPGHELPVARGRSLRMVFDAGRFTHALALRAWRPGDRLFPAGMGGHRKKLQDLFTDMKIPRADRDRLPVLVAPEGILWVVGCRADRRFMPDDNTKQVLIVEVEPALGQ
jgi:tRNA(Ile)-lysidine synthase